VSKIHDAVADIRFRFEQSVQRTPVTQHRRCRGTYLHETDLPDTSNGTGVIGAFDLRHRIRNFGGKTRLFCLTSDGLQMGLASWCIGLRHSDESLDERRQRDRREIGIRCFC
jgi:hypothetical protein